MRGRGPVVHLNRSRKAGQIEAVVRDYRGQPTKGLRTLDIGCGNGGISNVFCELNEHYGVDIADQRKQPCGDFEFRQVDSALLPFGDGFFDVVLSNHVIEHVPDQSLHLSEIRRVLTPGGCAYLATPNRSSPIMEGHVGNPLVLKYRDMAPLFRNAGFIVKEYALDVAADPARFAGEVAWAKFLPRSLLKLARPLFPSHIFMLSPA